MLFKKKITHHFRTRHDEHVLVINRLPSPILNIADVKTENIVMFIANGHTVSLHYKDGVKLIRELALKLTQIADGMEGVQNADD